VAAYQKRVEAEALANAQKAAAEGRADAARLDAQGVADAVKIKAKAEADAAEMQATSITKLAEANREAGLKSVEVHRQQVAAQNAKSPEILLAEVAHALIAKSPELMRELVKPAERIGEIKVLQVAGVGFGGGGNGANGDGARVPVLGTALSPIAKTIIEASAMLPVVKEMLRFADVDAMKSLVGRVAPGLEKPLEALAAGSRPPGSPGVTAAPPPRPAPPAGATTRKTES